MNMRRDTYMDNKKNVNITFSGFFFTLLAIVFITLKLLGKITWPWVWVLAPIWMPFVVGIIFIIVAILLYKWALK